MSGESEEMQDGGSGVGEPHGPGPRHWQRVYFTARGPESADSESEGLPGPDPAPLKLNFRVNFGWRTYCSACRYYETAKYWNGKSSRRFLWRVH